jgi:hypothetical protein
MTFGSRNLLGVWLSAIGIKKPSLESRAGLVRNRLFGVVVGDSRASGSEGRRNIWGQGNSNHNERRRRGRHRDLLEHHHPSTQLARREA